ncbi:hypothetical protein [Yersinia bercovieri]|uniref:hypothetical protein n=1 Tax=Yersinia bercovieri TaxID=634 RepID=UPI0005DC86B2|nr:hypothetical protein [Yersinia bercovieri]MDN0105262.1 hypothetical protein [Yersinia bercovieri]CNI60558.1 phage-like protein [Yersinia bercovieri]
MNEKPILFNSEMVNAILSGRKTQTRRIMGNQPAGQDLEAVHVRHNDDFNFQWYGNLGESSYFPCPLGKPGDQLWVREAFATGLCTESTLAYRATHKPEDLEEGWGETIKWTPSIHMPRWASRINLLITGVRVERLNDISEQDARAEGVKAWRGPAEELVGGKLAFFELWDSIYGQKEGENWQANPWVWVIEFERMEAK